MSSGLLKSLGVQMVEYDDERADALKWVKCFYPTAADDELPRSISEFSRAMENDFCADNCLGLLKCKTHGYIRRPAYDKLRQQYYIVCAPCPQASSERDQNQVVARVECSGIPERFKDATFDTFTVMGVPGNVGVAKSMAEECAKKDFSLILGGAPGTGKTHLAVAMAKVQLAKGKSVIFSPIINLLNNLKKGFEEGNVDVIMDSVRKAGFVVLDDFGAQKDTDWVVEYVFGLIDDRYCAKRPTVITTNAENEVQFVKMIKDRGYQIYTRIQEHGCEHWMHGCKNFRSLVRQKNLGI